MKRQFSPMAVNINAQANIQPIIVHVWVKDELNTWL